ncbi:MAG: radical SAM family heme chaperone HemW [Elusimicrobiota bacterium]|jgi:oxygen-independent coproporphyrinogen-3 oxidase|nr:radical SAM family heme chaperone HemW [Elusimicrobiota bacterium]
MLGLYIHIPFCRQKCFYCDFFSIKYDENQIIKYISALLNQAKQFSGAKIDTIYIGGGTPSVLFCGQIEKLIGSLHKIFDLSNLKEWTFELNPESADDEKLKFLKRSGVNRLSIGLQSCNDDDLRFLGRVHNFKRFVEVFESIGNVGFKNTNIDLIYGLPARSIKDWQKILGRALQFDCSHLSLYPLSIEKETLFYQKGISVDENMQNDLYQNACKILSQNNFIHYEISNWAKDGKESLHNSNYWRNYEYIGLGASAAGYFKNKRYKNVENIERYISSLCHCGQESSIEQEEYIDDELRKIESIMLGLRLLNEGTAIENFDNGREKILNNLLEQKMLYRDNDRIKLSKDFVFLSNSIISQFMK